MAEEQRLRVELSGGGPWGFRLQGGTNGEPVSVSKIRRRSKADLAELKEGDILVKANGININSRTHAQTMDLVDDAGANLTLEVIRPGVGGYLVSANPSVRQETLTSVEEPDSNSTRVVRKDTVTETSPDGSSRRTTTTITKQHSSSMPFSQVTNTTPRPFSPSDGGSSILANSSQNGRGPGESVTLTIETSKENVPPQFRVKPILKQPDAGPVAWSPDASSQDPYHEETYSQNSASVMYMNSPSVSYEEQETGFGVAPLPKVMPATPGLPSVDIQKLLEPAESPPDTPTKLNMRIYLDPSAVEAVAPRKMYADSAFFDDPESKYPTIQEQVKMAHQVAKLLMSEAAVKKSRGSQMFTKRRERAEKWVHEASEDEEEPHKPGRPMGVVTRKPPPETYYPSLRPQAQIGVWNPIQAGPPPNAPPPPPIHAPPTPINFHELQDPKNTHTEVSPEKCFNLAAALHASKGRGGQIFAKRRAKSESWVVDDTNVKAPPPPVFAPSQAMLRPKAAKNQKFERSPWEAAVEGQDSTKRHTVGPDAFYKMPDMSNVPKAWSPADVKNTHNFRAEQRDKKNFKDFNVRARGWGDQSNNDDRRSSSSRSSTSTIERQSSIPSSEDSTSSLGHRARGGPRNNRFSMGHDPRQPNINRNDLRSALGARGFVAVGSSGASDL